MRFLKTILAAAILLLSFPAFAQSSDAKFTHTQVIEASADEVWGLIR